MNLVLLQQGSLGDIFFIQKLAKELNKKYNVYHPITQQMWSAGCCQLKTPVEFGWNINLPRSDVFSYDCGNQPCNSPAETMTSKYGGMDWSDWASYFTYERDYEREYNLFNQLGLNDGEPYIFASKHYSVYKTHGAVKDSIPKDWDGKVIWMEPAPDTRVFDWCSVIENAEQIHIADTCINYIVDTLNITANRLVVHPRHYKWTKLCLEKLWSAPWEWAEYDIEYWRKMVPGEDFYND